MDHSPLRPPVTATEATLEGLCVSAVRAAVRWPRLMGKALIGLRRKIICTRAASNVLHHCACALHHHCACALHSRAQLLRAEGHNPEKSTCAQHYSHTTVRLKYLVNKL